MKHTRTVGKKTAQLFLFCAALLILVLPGNFQAGASPSGKHFLWKVRANSGIVYVLGSVHFFRKELYPLPEKIERAFAESDTLVVEADINDLSIEKMMTMLEGAFYPEEGTLEKNLSPGTYGLAKAKLAASGLPIELFQKTKPWLLALMISALEMQKLGLDPQYGIDMHFLNKARDRKRIAELESIGFQARLLSSLPDAEQDLFLRSTIKEQEVLEKEMNTLLRAWTSGDTEAMESLFTRSAGEEPGMGRIYEKLLGERNMGMTERIEGFLSAGGRYFVVVGAGHLVGKRGIPELLKTRGYSVEQL